MSPGRTDDAVGTHGDPMKFVASYHGVWYGHRFAGLLASEAQVPNSGGVVMNMGRVLLNLTGLLAIVLIASTASGQGAPRNLDRLLNMQGQPTADEQAQIQRYADHWLRRLAGDDADEVAEAADELLDPPSNQLATAAFRIAYSKATLEGLERVLEDGSTYQAVQAMKVTSFLGSRDAMELAMRHVSAANEPRWKVRLWAAKGARILLAQLQRDNARPAQIDGYLRRILTASHLEDNWVVLLRDFEAMASVRREVGREAQVEALQKAIDRMEQASRAPSDLMLAVCRVIDSLLIQYIDPALSLDDQRKFGRALGVQLARVYEIAEMHWDKAQSAEQANKAYERAISGSDRLLQLIDSTLQTTSGSGPELRPAWISGNRVQFESGTKTWTTRVKTYVG